MMKFLLLLSIFLTYNQVSHSQWVQQQSGTTNHMLDINFINDLTGWACGYGTIVKTTDGGVNWHLQNQPSTNIIQSIYPIDSMYAYAVGWFNTILKTTDGGKEWIAIRNGVPGDAPSFEGVHFLNKDTGWICGNVVMFKTTNGGITFDSVRIEAVLFDVFFKNQFEGVSCGQFGAFYKTTNGGLNWDEIQVLKGTTQYSFYKLSFIEDQGWLLGSGAGGPVYKTTDFGSSWDSIGLVQSLPNDIYTVEFTDKNNGWAGGMNKSIFKTTDGGIFWIQQNTSKLPNSSINSIYAINDSILWAVGDFGKIFFTENGGTSSIYQHSNELPDDFELDQNYPNPFNNSTKIKFSIRKKELIKLEIYDLIGRKVDFVSYGIKDAGRYELTYVANKLTSGVYFYRMYFGERYFIKKFVLSK